MNTRLIGSLGLALCTVATACNTSSTGEPAPGETDISALSASSMNVAA